MPKAVAQHIRPVALRRELSEAERELRSLPFVTVWTDDDDDEHVCFWSPPELHNLGRSAEASLGTLGRGYAIEAIEHMLEYPDNKNLLMDVARDMIARTATPKEKHWTQCELEFWALISEYVATGRACAGANAIATATFTAPESE